MRFVSGAGALAGRLPLSGVRARQGLGAFDHGVHLGECASRRQQTWVAAGTVTHGSKLPLTVWFRAAYLMATHSNCIAALQLQAQLGLGSYKSAWLLCAFVEANLAPGATARTDGWSGYPGVTHDRTSSARWPHRVFANLKTWALCVYHGLRQQHLQSYLDEFSFRFNRHRTRHAAFRSLLGIAIARMPTYNMLIKPEATA